MINRSVNVLEYKFASTLEKLFRKANPTVLFTAGHGELGPEQTATIQQQIGTNVTTGRLYLDSVYVIDPKVDMLVVAGPDRPISDKNKFKIDQYLMNGGKVVWIVEQLNVNLDSINQYGIFVPKPNEHDLDDMFFKYGVRINKDLVLSCLLYTSPSPRDRQKSRMPSSA